MTVQTANATDSAALTGSSRSTFPRWMLRVESLGILAAALAVYGAYDFAWWMLPVLLLAPDLSMLGYLVGTRTGAVVYNLAHIYATPLALGAVALLAGWSFGFQFSLIWVMHIAVDRTLGYGLKYADSFKHTHLDAV